MIKFLLLIPVAVALFIGAVSFYLQPNDFIGCGDTPQLGSGKCEKADAIVVVSGGDTNARTDEGIKLYKNGWADTLVFSGAAKDKTGLSNATAMRLRAVQEGVEDRAIYTEETSETTEENAANTQSIFEDQEFRKVILVTSGYHQRRASLEFEARAKNAQILNHPLLVDKDWNFAWWLTPRGWWLAGGEIVKIIAFYVQGVTR